MTEKEPDTEQASSASCTLPLDTEKHSAILSENRKLNQSLNNQLEDQERLLREAVDERDQRSSAENFEQQKRQRKAKDDLQEELAETKHQLKESQDVVNQLRERNDKLLEQRAELSKQLAVAEKKKTDTEHTMQQQMVYYAQIRRDNEIYRSNELVYKDNEKFYKERIQQMKDSLRRYEEERKELQQRAEGTSSLEPKLREEMHRVVERNKSLVSERDEMSRANEELRARVIFSCMQRDARNFNNVSDEHRQERAIQEFRALWSTERLTALDVLEDVSLEAKDACQLLASVMTVSYDVVTERVNQVLQRCEQCTEDLLLPAAAPAPQNSDLRYAIRNLIKLQFSQLDFNECNQAVLTTVSSQHGIDEALLQQLDFRSFSLQAVRVAFFLALQSPPLTLEADPTVAFCAERHQIYADCLRPQEGFKILFFVWPALVSGDGREVFEKGTVYV